MSSLIKIFSKNISNEERQILVKLFPSIFINGVVDKDKFNLIFETVSNPQIVYHYTSVNTLLAILTRQEQELEKCKNDSVKNHNSFVLRGTHIDFLNDSTEFVKGGEILIELIKEFEKACPATKNRNISNLLNRDVWKQTLNNCNFSSLPFITSFSENPNNLPMWNTYASGGMGVAIGIKKDFVNEWDCDSEYGKPTWGKCVYDKAFFSSCLNKNIDAFYKIFENNKGNLRINGDIDFERISSFLSIYKNSAYEYEKEWRLIKYCSNSDYNKEIKFQEIDGLLKPYVENIFPKSVLKEIVLGPCSNQELLHKSIRMNLLRAGYCIYGEVNNDECVKIIKSNAPFRHI
jgi:hypothetical protein